MHGNDAAALLLYLFIIGVVVGVFLIVSWASYREDSLKSLRGAPPDNACGGARRINGISRRDALADVDDVLEREDSALARGRQLDR